MKFSMFHWNGFFNFDLIWNFAVFSDQAAVIAAVCGALLLPATKIWPSFTLSMSTLKFQVHQTTSNSLSTQNEKFHKKLPKKATNKKNVKKNFYGPQKQKTNLSQLHLELNVN
jgi:hypothetical protein